MPNLLLLIYILWDIGENSEVDVVLSGSFTNNKNLSRIGRAL